MRKYSISLSFIFLSAVLFAQEKLPDPVNEHSKIKNIYVGIGMNTVHYTNWSGTYDSTQYTIDNSFPNLNFNLGLKQNLYFDISSDREFIFGFGADLTNRGFRINYLNELIRIREVYLSPMLAIGIRSDVKHSLWLINSHKAVECRLNFGLPVMIGQSAIIDHSKVSTKSAVFIKYHIGLDVRMTSMQSNAKGHQAGGEIFIENSLDTPPSSMLFATPYYIGVQFYYCLSNLTGK